MPERSCPLWVSNPRSEIPRVFNKEGRHMNKRLVVLSAMLGVATLGFADTKKEQATDRLDNAAKVLHEVMAAPDKGIPNEVFDHAKCVAVVPHMVKGGFVIGAEGGKGVATCRTASGWSAPA